MLSAEELNGLHQEAANLFRGSLVLLGGSYHAGNPTDASDVDMYVISPLFKFCRIWHRRREWKKWTESKKPIDVQFIIVPSFLFRLGVYYVCGHDLNGKEFCSVFKKELVERMAFKLSAFYGLKFIIGQTEFKRKAAKQLSILKVALSGGDSLPCIIPNYNWEREELLKYDDSVFAKFSWINYFVYNLHFLPRGDFSFLFCNPDKKVWRKLRACLVSGKVAESDLIWLEKYVFPIFSI